MQDTMNALMKAMNSLKKATTVLNAWTILVIIILAGLIGVNVFLPSMLNEPFLTILGGVYLAFLLILLIINKLVKDTQKQIMIGLVRAMLGLILALPLFFLCFTLLMKVLSILFAIVFLVILVLLAMPISKLLKFQKQLMPKPEAKAEAKPKPEAKPKAKPTPKPKPKAKSKPK
jgi:hypothetical protein